MGLHRGLHSRTVSHLRCGGNMTVMAPLFLFFSVNTHTWHPRSEIRLSPSSCNMRILLKALVNRARRCTSLTDTQVTNGALRCKCAT